MTDDVNISGDTPNSLRPAQLCSNSCFTIYFCETITFNRSSLPVSLNVNILLGIDSEHHFSEWASCSHDRRRITEWCPTVHREWTLGGRYASIDVAPIRNCGIARPCVGVILTKFLPFAGRRG